MSGGGKSRKTGGVSREFLKRLSEGKLVKTPKQEDTKQGLQINVNVEVKDEH